MGTDKTKSVRRHPRRPAQFHCVAVRVVRDLPTLQLEAKRAQPLLQRCDGALERR